MGASNTPDKAKEGKTQLTKGVSYCVCVKLQKAICSISRDFSTLSVKINDSMIIRNSTSMEGKGVVNISGKW